MQATRRRVDYLRVSVREDRLHKAAVDHLGGDPAAAVANDDRFA
jgi:hypothetical protein